MRIVRVLYALMLLIALPLVGEANEPKQFFVRTGYFSWSEYTKDGRVTFEHGPVVAYGYDRVMHREERMVVTGTCELWGGFMNRFEHDVLTGLPDNCKTGYFGTKEEVNIDVRLIDGPRFYFGPRFGFQHKMWVRASNREWWNMFVMKAGTSTEIMLRSGYRLYGSYGIAATAFSYDYVHSYSINYSDVWLRPGNRYSMFAEYGIQTPKKKRFSISYEPMEFAPSLPKTVGPVHGHGPSHVFVQSESKAYAYWLKFGLPF